MQKITAPFGLHVKILNAANARQSHLQLFIEVRELYQVQFNVHYNNYKQASSCLPPLGSKGETMS